MTKFVKVVKKYWMEVEDDWTDEDIWNAAEEDTQDNRFDSVPLTLYYQDGERFSE